MRGENRKDISDQISEMRRVVGEFSFTGSACGYKSGAQAPHSKVLGTWLKPGTYINEPKRGYLDMPRSK